MCLNIEQIKSGDDILDKKVVFLSLACTLRQDFSANYPQLKNTLYVVGDLKMF